MRTVTDQIRGGMMWFAVLLVPVMYMFTAVIAGGRIDSPEEFVVSLQRARTSSVPMAFAVFMLVSFLPRPAVAKRVALAILVGVVCWFLVWKWIVHSNYSQLRERGLDPDKVLQTAEP
jgi:hypothetical protein